MIDWQQQALKNQLKLGLGSQEGIRANVEATPQLVEIANALVKTMQSHEKAIKLAEELSKHKTPEELLRISVEKIKGQSLATQRAIIKELRKHLAKLAPMTDREKDWAGDNIPSEDSSGPSPAATALANLGDEED
jgi:hypothetical protein